MAARVLLHPVVDFSLSDSLDRRFHFALAGSFGHDAGRFQRTGGVGGCRAHRWIEPILNTIMKGERVVCGLLCNPLGSNEFGKTILKAH
ncbi:hypothetical protein LAV78_16070 [Brucella intermedia]|uniref:hypothetical protein n=1 Tax=Brucella intermedia TaxID=94625 RepID=UPI001E46084F|nr:hypothetical protein [Brucella intermedia]MCB4920039.1 hypothetical protein [Brucella intermedia]